MATNLSIESPDFDLIKKGNFNAIEDAMRLLWFVANDESARRRQNDRLIGERYSPKVVNIAPSGATNNLDSQGAGLLLFTGTTSLNLTGIIARTEGDILFCFVQGSGTITFKHNSGSSDSGNVFLFQSAADVAVTTNKALILQYLLGKWRELKLA